MRAIGRRRFLKSAGAAAELDKPVTAGIRGGTAVRATHGRLKIGEVDKTRPIPKNATAAVFRVELKPGKTRLETWLTDKPTGKAIGAFYVVVRRLGKSN